MRRPGCRVVRIRPIPRGSDSCAADLESGLRKAETNILQERDTITIQAAEAVLSGESRKNWYARLLPFLGPAFIACVAYVDPGNFATNIQGGAEYGYLLVWVILSANLMAMLIQSLSAKLG